MNSVLNRIVIDGREFIQNRSTGIGRVLCGLLNALLDNNGGEQIILAVTSIKAVPAKLKTNKKIKTELLPSNFFKSEKVLSRLTKKSAKIFISPYPKIPLFGSFCPTIHTIHDVLDLTHPAYRKKFKVWLDRLRIKRALKNAEITWYDSSYSLEATKELIGSAGKNPKVRYPGIDSKFNPKRENDEICVLKKYNLNAGYILVAGNGLPHKNLGVLLQISNDLSRKLVFVGVSVEWQYFWKKHFPTAKAKWINYILDDELPILIKNSFCLAQPSTAEGYGYPPLEAMACGVPAVVSSIPVLIETTGGVASTASPHEPKEWKDAFSTLENPNIYLDKKVKGLKWTESLIGDRAFNQHIADIEELIRGK